MEFPRRGDFSSTFLYVTLRPPFAATFFSAAASGSASTLGFGTPVLVALAVAGVAAMIAAVMKARSAAKAGDMFSPANGKTMVSTREGGLFELSPNDDFMAAPGLAAAAGGGGGGTNTARMESQQAASNEKLDRMVDDDEMEEVYYLFISLVFF